MRKRGRERGREKCEWGGGGGGQGLHGREERPHRLPLAGFDNFIICTLRAAVRRPAPTGCRAARGAARGGS